MRTMLFLAMATAMIGACAEVSTTKVTDLASAPQGVRVYPPRIYLLVDNATGGVPPKQTTVITLPDFRRAYDIKPTTILAKQNFKVELDDGLIKTLSTDQDTTGFLTFVKDIAQSAAKAAGLPMSASSINSTGGLPNGLYVLDDDGTLRRYAGNGADLMPMR